MASKKTKVKGKEIPSSLPILGYEWQVDKVPSIPSDEDEIIHGTTEGPKYRITVALEAHPTEEALEATLMHEVVHAVLHMAGLSNLLDDKQEEALAVAIEHGLFPLYKRR